MLFRQTRGLVVQQELMSQAEPMSPTVIASPDVLGRTNVSLWTVHRKGLVVLMNGCQLRNMRLEGSEDIFVVLFVETNA